MELENGWVRAPEQENEDFDEAVFWEPDEGDVLEGEVKVVKEGKYNLFAMVEDNEGTVFVTPQHKDLSTKLSVMEIEKGDTIRIQYNGEEDIGMASPKKKYTLDKYVGE